MPVPSEWVDTAVAVTGRFEDSANPIAAVTGNFDGMGISLGVLQWNIGSNSLQPMVEAVGRDKVCELMPTYGNELWNACTSNVSTGLRICNGWQHGAQFLPAALAELNAFTSSAPFVAQQMARVNQVCAAAYASAEGYAGQDPVFAAGITKALFCWFFDLYTQNGGLKGLGYADVQSFNHRNGSAQASVGVVCDWLASRQRNTIGYRDSNANAAMWRNGVADGRASLLVLSYLRAQLSRQAYQADVLNRKGTVAVQRGWVHREQHDLSALLQ